MKAIERTLSPDAIDLLVKEIAPAGLKGQELEEFKDYLGEADTKQIKHLSGELKAAIRIWGRKVMLREQLLQRMGTQLVIRQQEVVEARLAELEVGKDVADLNAMELEVSQQTWDLGKTGKVRRLYEQAEHDPLGGMIKRHQVENEHETRGPEHVNDETLKALFEIE